MLTGKSPEIIAIRRMIREIAKTDDNVLIIGEVGSGKQRVAEEIHQRSQRHNKPFVVLNCTAVGDTILDADLFGQTFEGDTGKQRTIGLFEQANNGIIYLDNLGDLKSEYQQRFLNIFHDGRFRRLDEDGFTDLDTRVVGAVDDEKFMERTDFRHDLLEIVNRFHIHVPPLRQRKQDIPILFSHFLEELCQKRSRPVPPVPTEIFESLIEYKWHGNVQELMNTVRNLVMMSEEGKLSVEYLPFEIKKHPLNFLKDKDLPEAVAEVEMFLLRKMLQKFAGNQTKTAHALNVSEATLRYKMKKYGFNKEMF